MERAAFAGCATACGLMGVRTRKLDMTAAMRREATDRATREEAALEQGHCQRTGCANCCWPG
jgi:hypothetical protein